MWKGVLLFLLFSLFAGNSYSQIYDPVVWSYSAQRVGSRVYMLTFKAKIPYEWVIYSMYTPKRGPKPFSIQLEDGAELFGNAVECEPKKEYDKTLGVDVWSYSDTYEVSQKIHLVDSEKKYIRGKIDYQARKEGVNVFLEKDFVLKLDEETGQLDISEPLRWRAEADSVFVNGEFVRYSNYLHSPDGIRGFFDYDQALKYAQAQRKPLFILFTGVTCYGAGARDMEFMYFYPEFSEIINEEYVFVSLYMDFKIKLPEDEWYISKYDGKLKNTIGKKNSDFQKYQFNSIFAPLYILLDSRGGNDFDLLPHLLLPMKGYTRDREEIAKFLQDGVKEYKARANK